MKIESETNYCQSRFYNLSIHDRKPIPQFVGCTNSFNNVFGCRTPCRLRPAHFKESAHHNAGLSEEFISSICSPLQPNITCRVLFLPVPRRSVSSVCMQPSFHATYNLSQPKMVYRFSLITNPFPVGVRFTEGMEKRSNPLNRGGFGHHVFGHELPRVHRLPLVSWMA